MRANAFESQAWAEVLTASVDVFVRKRRSIGCPALSAVLMRVRMGKKAHMANAFASDEQRTAFHSHLLRVGTQAAF